MPIKKKLIILFIAFTLIPLLLFATVIFPRMRSILMTVRIAQLNNIADLKIDKIETFFNERAADIRSSQNFLNIKRNLPILCAHVNERNNPDYRKALGELNEQLKPFQNAKGYIDLMLTDASGRVVYAANEKHRKTDIGNFLPDRKIFDEGRKGVYFSDVLKNKVSDGSVEMLAAAPLHDYTGKFIGEIVIEIDMGPIYKFIQDATGLGNTGEALIAKKEGNGVLFLSPVRQDENAALSKTAAFGQNLASPAQHAVKGENGSGITTDYHGAEVLAAWRYVPLLRWGLVTKIDAAEAFLPVTHMSIFIIVIGSCVLFIGTFAALSIAKTVTDPILTLQRDAEAIAAGDLSNRVGTRAKDEVGQLSRAFDSMTDALVRDITERKQAEEEVKSLNEQLNHKILELEASNKELEAFSYSVSHDLRAPLRSIDGFSQALMEDYAGKLDAQGKDFLQLVRSGSQRMAQLIDDLLNLSRVTRSEMKRGPVNLSKLAREIAERLKKTHPERSVEFVIKEGLGCEGDVRLLRVALENLLGNAWKFTEKQPAAKIEFGMQEHEGRPAYFIKDNGAGFNMDYVDKLFSPFQRLHGAREFPGTGIGLATVQRIIHRHGGRVWIEGDVNKGATVYFTL